MTEKITTIGIIGGGFGKRVLLPVCLQHPLLSVKWLAVRRNFPNDVPADLSVTLRWEDIIEDAEVQAVAIATPHDLHAEQVRACLAADKHVLCEKPLALSAQEARDLAEQCDRAKRVGVVDYSFRYIPQRSLFHSLIVRGLIGRPQLLRMSFFRNDFERWPSQWYYERQRGGGALIATGSHLVDSVHWLTQSTIRWVNAVVRPENNIDVGFSMMMETESGCTCAIDVSHCIPGPGKHTIEAYGENGSLFLDAEERVVKLEGNNVQVFSPEERHRFGFGNQPWEDESRLQPTAKVVDLLVQKILNPLSDNPIDFWTATRNQSVIEAIQISYRERRRVQVQKLT